MPDNIEEHFKQGYAKNVIPTDVKRVIIPLPAGVIGKDVEYTSWDGSLAKGNGFLFQNDTDKRAEFIKSADGIFIGHEGECPEGPNGEMIMRSQAVFNYLKKHPDALSDENHIKQTVAYFQKHVFRHAGDPTKWDENASPDIWSSDQTWLKKNFNEEDVFNEDGSIRSVISAAKKTEVEYDAVYFGPNVEIKGLGETGDRGSYIVRKPDGAIDLCEAVTFDKTYKNAHPIEPVTFHGGDVFYPKGSSRYIEPQNVKTSPTPLSTRIERSRKECAKLQTPIFRVLGAALCDYIETNQQNTIRVELEINSLIAHDKNELSVVSSSPKSQLLKPLIEAKIVNTNGDVINPKALADSDFVRNYKGKGIDLTSSKTMMTLANQTLIYPTKENTIE